MSSRQMSILSTLEKVFAFVGGTTGLIAVLSVVFYGGSLTNTLNATTTRLNQIEQVATPTAREHIKVDEERDKAITERVIRLEAAIIAISEWGSDFKGDLRVLGQKIDTLTKELDQNHKNP